MNLVLGTPGYIAPEILLRREYNSKVDIWSVGCMLYSLFHKKLPYNGVTDEEMLQEI